MLDASSSRFSARPETAIETEADRSEAILSRKLEMTLGSDISAVSSMLDALEEFAAENGIPPQKIMRLNLVLDELVTNTIMHGFTDGADGSIRLAAELVDGTVNVALIDNGVAFNPVEAASPERSGGIEEREIGGLGLKLIRSYVKRLDYRRDGAFNHLHLEMDIG